MQHALMLNQPLQSIFWPKTVSYTKEVMLVLAGVMFLAISSHIIIPLQPIPITFQSAVVILVGMVYGARMGGITLCAYLIAGSSGLPVFAPTASIYSMGYLIGFLPAAILSGYLAQNGWGKSFLTCFVATLLSAVVIFSFGIPVLAMYIGWEKAVMAGLMPFIFSEPLKLLAVSLIVPRCWK